MCTCTDLFSNASACLLPLSLCLHLPAYISLSTSVCLSLSVSVCLSLSVSVCLCLSVSVFLCLSRKLPQTVNLSFPAFRPACLRGFARGGFQKGCFGRCSLQKSFLAMLPWHKKAMIFEFLDAKNQNEGTLAKTAFYKTALLFPLEPLSMFGTSQWGTTRLSP